MSKIPEGATHTYTDSSGTTYRKKVLDNWHAYADGDWWHVVGPAEKCYIPIQAKPEWSGEGIPPSGTTCEMRRADYVNVGWQQIEFLFAGSKKAFFRDAEGHEWSRPLSDLKFRSIRTPEQIASEKRIAAINWMEIDAGMCATAFDGDPEARRWIENLIDKGWRKEQVK